MRPPERDTPTGAPFFTFYKADRRVTAYYFYVNDAHFGHGFIKICAYFPYPGKVWVNGLFGFQRGVTVASRSQLGLPA